jgi:preprotein translocase subunit SecE
VSNVSGVPATRQSGDGIFARIALFVRQVIAELKKVVAPSRAEMIRMTLVVLMFVLIIMALVYAIDWVIQIGVVLLFGGTR